MGQGCDQDEPGRIDGVTSCRKFGSSSGVSGSLVGLQDAETLKL